MFPGSSWLLALCCLGACESASITPRDAGGGGPLDAGPTDAGPAAPDAERDARPEDASADAAEGGPVEAGPVDAGCVPRPDEACNGRDDDCDGEIDEDCVDLPPVTLRWPWSGYSTGSARAAAAPIAHPPLRPELRWEPVSGAASFEVQLDAAAAASARRCLFTTPAVSDTVDAPALRWSPSSDLPVGPSTEQPVGRRYCWRVRACNGRGCGAWSADRYLDVGRLPDDVDGDGFSDVIVGCQRCAAAGVTAGAALVYRGSAAGVGARPDATLRPPAPQASAEAGHAVASGDLDADGFADVVVAMPGVDAAGSPAAGGLLVYRGSPDGLVEAPRLLENRFPERDARLGTSVAVGDVDGDGYADVVVGAPNEDASRRVVDSGTVTLFFGGAGGVEMTAAVELAAEGPDGAGPGAAFGTSVSVGSDVDGDGLVDLVVGAPYHASRVGASGQAYLFTHLDRVASGGAAVTLLADPLPERDGRFGYAVAGVGDADGDGLGDVVVGAQLQDAGRGRAALYLGRSALPALLGADVGIDSPAATTESWLFGETVTGLGDVDGDGQTELAIGCPRYGYPSRGTEVGTVYVYGGAPLDRPVLAIDDGTTAGGLFGLGLASVGDVNGDGYADLGVGAIFASSELVTPASDHEGVVHLFLGSATGLPRRPSVTLDNPEGRTGAEMGTGLAAVGDRVDGHRAVLARSGKLGDAARPGQLRRGVERRLLCRSWTPRTSPEQRAIACTSSETPPSSSRRSSGACVRRGRR